MTKLSYEIVEVKGGYAYKVGDGWSETFPSRDDALSAAEERMPGGEMATGQTEGDARRWRNEMSNNDDRPETDIIKDAAHRY